MATLAVDVGAPYAPAGISLCAALTGSVSTTNIIDRGGRTGPVLLEVITTVGSTPTCTYLVEGSVDGASFFAVPHADPASPGTFGVATFGPVTSATTTRRVVQSGQPWRYLRVTMSANTNVTNTINAYFF
jgi:hypothetical protein